MMSEIKRHLKEFVVGIIANAVCIGVGVGVAYLIWNYGLYAAIACGIVIICFTGKMVGRGICNTDFSGLKKWIKRK